MRTHQGREYIRHPASIPIVVKPHTPSQKAPKPTAAEESAVNLALNNVSQGGLAFDSPTNLQHGTIVDIEINIVEPTFEVQGIVQWCKAKAFKQGCYEVGVEFVDHEDLFRVRMIEQVCHIEQYRIEREKETGHPISGQKAALEWIAEHAAEFPNPNEPTSDTASEEERVTGRQ